MIDCEPAVQIQRACERSGLSVDEVEKIIATQTPRTQRNQLANDILSNNGSVDELRKKVTQLHEKYIDTCTFK